MRWGDLISAGECLFEVTQIGKKCHHGCAIFQRVGQCEMRTHGVFTRVLRGYFTRWRSSQNNQKENLMMSMYYQTKNQDALEIAKKFKKLKLQGSDKSRLKNN